MPGLADIVLAGLDNREARLWINRACWKMKKPWIDGAIEGINGVARLFMPGQPPCYECTLGETDWAILNKRMSCNLLTLESDTEGKVATTPTISSIIGGLQVQEAVKLLHGLPVLAGKGFIFEGLNAILLTRVEYTENADCMSHYTFAEVTRLQETSRDLTLAQLLTRARRELGSQEVAIEFSRDVIHKLVCPGLWRGRRVVRRCRYGALCTRQMFQGWADAGRCHGTWLFRNRIIWRADPRPAWASLYFGRIYPLAQRNARLLTLIVGDERQVLGQMATGAAR